MMIAEGDLSVGMQYHHHQLQVFQQFRHAPFRRIQRHFGKLQFGDVAVASPDAPQCSIFDNAPLASQQIPAFAVQADGRRFHRGEPVLRTDGMEDCVADDWIRQRSQVVHPAAGYLLRPLEPRLARQRIVTLRDIAIPVYAFHLFLLRRVRWRSADRIRCATWHWR